MDTNFPQILNDYLNTQALRLSTLETQVHLLQQAINSIAEAQGRGSYPLNPPQTEKPVRVFNDEIALEFKDLYSTTGCDLAGCCGNPQAYTDGEPQGLFGEIKLLTILGINTKDGVISINGRPTAVNLFRQANRQENLICTEGSASERIERTAHNFVRAINNDLTSKYRAHYVSTITTLPGQVILEQKR